MMTGRETTGCVAMEGDEPITVARSLRARFISQGDDPLHTELRIEHGDLSDYAALRRFHYRSAHPGAIADITRMVRCETTVVGRYLQRHSAEKQTVGVVVRSLPALSCGLRGVATGDRYRGLSRRDAAIVLNREVRCISRVIIDPRFRGLGLAVHLVKHVLQRPPQGVIFTEALAAMGRVSPFFEYAGMQRFEQPHRAHRAHARLLDAFEHLRVDPAALGAPKTLAAELSSRGDGSRDLLEAELGRWHRSMTRGPVGSRSHRKHQDDVSPALECLHGNPQSFERTWRRARDRLFMNPVYYLFRH